jgi:PAS domain-containing protein
MRERLRRILEGLPCGVLVIEGGTIGGGRISALNPEAVRLVGGSFETVDALPRALVSTLESARATGEERELELPAVLEKMPERAPEKISQNGPENEANTKFQRARFGWRSGTPGSSAGCSRASSIWREIRSRKPHPSCSARHRRAFTCGVCSNHFFPKWWSFHRSKFHP